MTVSVLLRLVSEALAQGRVAGHAEIVDTGETVIFKDQDEMLDFLQRASAIGSPELNEQASANQDDTGSSSDAPFIPSTVRGSL